MENMDENIIALFKKRVNDMAGITPKSVSIYLNREKLQVENFEKYINMYIQATKEEDLEDLNYIGYCTCWMEGFILNNYYRSVKSNENK